jgi:hypothetical protein
MLNKIQIYKYVFEKEINEKKVFHKKEKETFALLLINSQKMIVVDIYNFRSIS